MGLLKGKEMAKLTDYVKEQLEVLKTENSVKVKMEPINDYAEAFEELGTYDSDWETNGWDVDFWISFTVQDQKYMLSGSWYYGGYSISKDED